ncbi:MAG: rod shape-determining protein [Candidatus Malihini olakiniferum]
MGGNQFDEAIINYIRRNYDSLIGETKEERIQHEMSSAYPVDNRAQNRGPCLQPG